MQTINKILENKIQCKHCGDIIQSVHVHDLEMCKCGKVGVDGGTEYLRRIGNHNDFIELSTFELVSATNRLEIEQER